ncbi:MAG: 4-oxalocrotonate tautomerase [Chloroflexi bacterium]|nr:4-oxalocrotonate tautomerase [Chloroflexota bacterium]|tara:strand:- start:2193 stop:2372 length:180 start_codon:yes stop_codon:yes gene_type:complete
MPKINITWYKGRTYEQKQKVAKAITNSLVEIVECKPEAVEIIFQDVDKKDCARAGVMQE